MPPKTGDKKKKTKISTDIPTEWEGTFKSLAYDSSSAPMLFLGDRVWGRAFASPHNWPATNSTPIHERKGPEWEEGGELFNYSHGVE